MTKSNVNSGLLVLNLPNPPFRQIDREYAGGFGTAHRVPWRNGEAPVLNLFLPYSASVAEETGWEYDVIDAQALRLSAHEVLQKVKKLNPSIVMSMIGLPSIYEDKMVLNKIKEELPNTLVIGCGTLCKVMPEEVLRGSNIDLVVNEDFPYINSLRNLLSCSGTSIHRLSGFSYVKESEVIRNQPEHHEKEFSECVPVYDVLPLEKYQHVLDLEGRAHTLIPVLGGKGCSYTCFYCPYPEGFGRKPVFQSPDLVVDQIENLHRLRNVEGFLFRSQSFVSNSKWAENICEEIMRRKLEISWVCEARIDEISKKLLALMKEAGCKRIHYGVETGDPDLFKKAKPGTHREDVYKVFDATKKMGIWAHAHIIIGLPEENQKTLEETSNLLLKLDPDSVSLNFATPYPGTQLYKTAEKNNWIITRNWANYSSFDVVMKTEALSVNDLYKAANKIRKHLRIRNISKLLSHPLDTNSLRLFISDLLMGVRTY